MTKPLTINRSVHVQTRRNGSKKLAKDKALTKPAGRVPRIARLLALAHHCRKLIRDGVIINQSELKHYAQVTTARMMHVMWLTTLVPDLQEAILSLPRVESGPDTVKEIDMRRIARVMDWGVQRSFGKQLADLSTQLRFTRLLAVSVIEPNWPPT